MSDLTIKVSIFLILAALFLPAACIYSAEQDTIVGETDTVAGEETEADALSRILAGEEEPSQTAADTFGPEQKTDIPDSSAFAVVARLILSLAIVVGTIYLAAIVARRLYGRHRAKSGKNAMIQVIDRAYLDSKKSIYLVKVVDRLLVIGVGNNDIRLLSTMKDQSVVDSVKTTDFSYHLKDFFGRFNRADEPVEEEAGAAK